MNIAARLGAGRPARHAASPRARGACWCATTWLVGASAMVGIVDSGGVIDKAAAAPRVSPPGARTRTCIRAHAGVDLGDVGGAPVESAVTA